MKRFPFIVLLASLTLSACAPPGAYRKVRAGIRGVAEVHLGPADRYEVKTSRDKPNRLLKGRISRVEVHGVNVRPKPQYLLDEVFICATNVVYDRKKKLVTAAETTSASAYITEQSLAFMLSETGVLKEPVVSIRENGVEVAGQYAVFGALPVSIVASGNVRISGRAGIEFVTDSVTSVGIKLPLALNKTFDLSTVYPALVVTEIRTETGRAVLTGTLDWSKFGDVTQPAG